MLGADLAFSLLYGTFPLRFYQWTQCKDDLKWGHMKFSNESFELEYPNPSKEIIERVPIIYVVYNGLVLKNLVNLTDWFPCSAIFG